MNLYLSYNQIEYLELKDFLNLTSIDVRNNPIRKVQLNNLPKIKTLNFSRLKISKITLINLPNLIGLDLNNNQITTISLAFIHCLPRLCDLQLYGNPIQNVPKEIFDKNDKSNPIQDLFKETFDINNTNVLESVKNYLEDIAKSSTENKEAKIVFIGNGSVGKTQVAKRLKEQNKFIFNTQHDSTQAIVLLRRALGSFNLNLWDFAGQDIYHTTHRLFLQTRALFVLVWDFENETKDFHEWQGKKYGNEKLRYWLEYAQCFAPQSPILVLQNKIDVFREDFYFEYREQLKAEYPQIIDFLSVSAKNGKGFYALEVQLEHIFETHKTFKTPNLPTDWVAVRQTIRNKQANKTEKTLSFEAFKTICRENNCEKSTITILNYLHDTGVVYYREGYFQNQIILNQDWAVQAIYKILDREKRYFEVLKYQKGTLHYKNICKIWADNTDEERSLFIDFMLSAELAFETKKDKYRYWSTLLKDRSFIIPQLLPTEKNNDINTWQERHGMVLPLVTLPYRFLPKVFIERFIVKAHRFSEVRLMWQHGILLRTTQGDALVMAVYEKENQRIEIYAKNDFVVEKIKDELEDIEGEGKLKSRRGKSETEKERFGLAALKQINQNINKNMNTTIKKAIDSLNNGSRSGYFEAMDKIIIPSHLKPNYAQLKRVHFSPHNVPFDFDDRLKVFAREVNRLWRENWGDLNISKKTQYHTAKNEYIDNNKEITNNTSEMPDKASILPSKKRILMLTANPAGKAKVNLKKEHSQIVSKLQAHLDQFEFKIKEEVNANEFKETTELQKPTILHFAGQGEKGKTASEGGIVLQNEDKNGYSILETDMIDVLFEYFKEEGLNIQVVILNACYSEVQASAISQYVPFVIGTTKVITTQNAVAFSTGFYFKIATNDFNVERAFKSGRTMAVLKGAKKRDFILFKNGEKVDG